MLSKYAREVLCDMMGVDEYKDVQEDLRNRVERVCSLVEKNIGVGRGSLESRQVIATIVEQWERDSLDKRSFREKMEDEGWDK